MADIIRTSDSRVQEIIKFKKDRQRAEEQSRAWDEILRQKVGAVPFDHVIRKYSRNLSDMLPDGAWAGRRCFIIGGGPSLKRVNFSRLEQELTIGVNRAFEKLDPTVIFWMDYQTFYLDLMSGKFGNEAVKKFMGSRALKVALNLSGYDYPADVFPLAAAPGDHNFTFSLSEGIGHGGNSGYAALNLAVCLGANPIYLLGFDMQGDGKGHQTWFHSGYERDQGEGVYREFIQEFEYAAPILEEKEIEVVNLNPDSALKCFPTGDIDKLKPPVKRSRARTYLIGKSDRPFVVISFYTRGTSYEHEVQKLITSLRKFNLPYHIFSFEPMGTWRANLNYKSACILQAMEMYPDKDIVFIDSDGIVRQDPVLFDELSGTGFHHVAAVYHTYSPESGDPDELLSGTLWLRNTGLTRGLVRKWHKIALEEPLVIHQRCLKYAIERMIKNGNPLQVFRMPWEYTCVFDYERSRGKQPVIEHFQASRRFRDEVGRGSPLIKAVQP